jgi:hypothetical protein
MRTKEVMTQFEMTLDESHRQIVLVSLFERKLVHIRNKKGETRMIRRVLFTGVTFVASLILASSFSYAYDRAIEAESADHIEPPMVVGDDPNASRDKFIWMEGAPLAGGGGAGWAEYKINLPTAGTYSLWGKVIAWDGNSDSFWVTWQPADPNEDPQVTQNTQFRWGVFQGAVWHWDRINHWLDGGTFDREWTLPAGETTLRIGVREDATMLDVIFITDNLSADEAEVQPRDPTEADLVAVEPKGKLTTTWASVKGQ